MNTWILKSLYLVLFRTVWQTVEATLGSLKKLHKTAKKKLARARGVFWEQENQVNLPKLLKKINKWINKKTCIIIFILKIFSASENFTILLENR